MGTLLMTMVEDHGVVGLLVQAGKRRRFVFSGDHAAFDIRTSGVERGEDEGSAYGVVSRS